MRTCLTISLILLPVLAIAQDSQPPLPTALTTAKTIYLVNAGVHGKVLENTVKALTKWGRFTLVPDAADSDMTLTLSAQPTKQAQIVNVFAAGGLQTVTINNNFLALTSTSDGTSLYGVTFGNNPEGEFKKLRKQLETP